MAIDEKRMDSKIRVPEEPLVDKRRLLKISPAPQRSDQTIPTTGRGKKRSLVSLAPVSPLKRSLPCKPSPSKSLPSILGVDQSASGLSNPIEADDDLKDLFGDMDDLVDPVVAKHAAKSATEPYPPDNINQASEKLKELLALELDDAVDCKDEIIVLAASLASDYVDMKELLMELVSTMVFERFSSIKSEAADLEQKLSERQKLGESFMEMPEALKSLRTDKQEAKSNVAEHETIIQDCEAEVKRLQADIERLQKKIADHRQQLGEAQHVAEERKGKFSSEHSKVADMKSKLEQTKTAVISWKEDHVVAAAKLKLVKREWAELAAKIICSFPRP